MGKSARSSDRNSGVDGDIGGVERLLASEDWQKRLDVAREQRAKVLAERARLASGAVGTETPLPKPWELPRAASSVSHAGPASARALMKDALGGIRGDAGASAPRPARKAPAPVAEAVQPDQTQHLVFPPLASAANEDAPSNLRLSKFRIRHVVGGFVLGFVLGGLVVLALLAGSGRLALTGLSLPGPAETQAGAGNG